MIILLCSIPTFSDTNMSRRVLQTACLNVTSESLTPFLYQTRTLLQSSRNVKSLISSRHIAQRTFSQVSSLCEGSRPSAETLESPQKAAYQALSASQDEAPTDERVAQIKKYGSGRTPSRPLRRVTTASTADGVHRKTRVEDRGALRTSTREARQQRSQDDAFFGHMTQGIDFEQGADEMWHGGKDEISDLARSQPLGESTITDSERYAFQRVFKDIFGRTQGQGATIRNDPGLMTTSTSSTSAAAPSTTKLSRWELEEMINRYPVPLRAAAARAMGLDQVEIDGEEEAINIESKLDLERLETLRGPERQRVETLMKGASSDFELWEIMETEVFSLIRKLGLEDAGEVPRSSNTKSTKNKRTSAQKKDVDAAPEALHSLGTFAVDDTGVSPLALYGPLYPAYLLLGIRLLDRYFSKSSSLTLSVLPKIKSLGVISHVLGASSQLYNELIQIYRYRHDNYRGILGLLDEMEHGGIEFDKETLDIVKDIERTQASVKRGEKGEVLQVLWNFPEFAPNKFKAWNEKITAALKKKELSRRVTVTY